MLYQRIIQLERRWPFFNKEPFTPNQIKKVLKSLDIIALKDLSVPEAMAFNYKNKNFICYNPCQRDSDLVLNIGHEIGHFMLGHIGKERPAIYSSVFSKKDREREAGIIGFLFWAPTMELCKMWDHGRLNIDELYKYTCFCDPEIDDDKALKLCYSRIRIFNAMRRVERFYPMARQLSLPFKATQLTLPGF